MERIKYRVETVTMHYCSIPCSAAESLNTQHPISQPFLFGLSCNLAWLLSMWKKLRPMYSMHFCRISNHPITYPNDIFGSPVKTLTVQCAIQPCRFNWAEFMVNLLGVSSYSHSHVLRFFKWIFNNQPSATQTTTSTFCQKTSPPT